MAETTVNSANKIVILTGPESTAKTSIALYLQSFYVSGYVSEYARNYVLGLNRSYQHSDIEKIAQWQKKQMDTCKRSNEYKIWFIDTYLIITKIWFKWFDNKCPDWLNKAILDTQDSLYLLCAPDIIWKPDDVRENGGENRIRLFDLYKKELDEHDLNYRIISGNGEERNKMAHSFVEEYIV